jgi:hypothetical protein
MGSVKVAVRLRPFNPREKKMNAVLCLEMKGAQTIITNPESKQEKKFTFDFSYWSHDSYKEEEDGMLVATSPKYHTQTDCFNDLGVGVLNNAFEGTFSGC